jgi:catechol 2,3-dioxygenase-like lactoylglutathione lyase family enzyme
VRRQRRSFAFIAIICLLVALSGTALADSRALKGIGMTVDDMDRSLKFYTGVLPFERISDVEVASRDYERLERVFGLRMRVVRLRLGTEFLELTDFLTPRGRPYPYDTRANDRWFQHIAIVVSDMDRAYAHLRRHNVEHASTGPQTLPASNKAAGGIRAFYFRDPDGHFLELIQFPPGKGDQRWQRSNGKLFLGIDHTAIVVANTEASLGFYRDTLGLRIAGGSENRGDEQEHLNNVEGAHLRITALRGASGPGVELLEYLAPRDGRPLPRDMRANDLAFWRIVMNGPLPRSLEQRGVTMVAIPDRKLGFGAAAFVRDPDGHTVELIEP